MKKRTLASLLLLLIVEPGYIFGKAKEFRDPEELRQEAVSAFEQRSWPVAETAAVQYLHQVTKDPKRQKMALLLAEAYFYGGKPDEALAAYQMALAIKTKDNFAMWSARLRSAECESQLGQVDKAQKELKDLSTSAPFSVIRSEALVDLAYNLLHQGKDAEAGSVLQNLISSNSQYRDDPRVGKALGYFLIRTGSVSQGYDALRRVTQFVSSTDQTFLFLQAMALELMGKHAQSLQALQQIIENAPNDYWKGESLYQIGESFFRQNMFDLARKSYEQMLPLTIPSRLKARAVLQLGSIALSRNQFQEAEELANKIIAAGKRSALPMDKDPLLWGSEYLLAETAMKTNQWAKAKTYYERVAKVPELGMEAKLKLLWLSLKEGEFNQAVAQANEFLEQYPWGEYAGQALILRAIGYQRGGNVDLSIRDVIQFLDKYPDHALKERATYLLALNYLQSKKWADLVAHISEARAHLEPRPTAWQAGILFCLAEGYYNLEEYEKAMQIYQELNVRFPRSRLSPYIYEGLAVCYAYLDKNEEALSAQAEAMSLAKEYKTQSILRYGLLALGNILFNKHNYKQSLAYDQTFTEQFPNDPDIAVILYRSGLSLDRLKRPREALEKWNKLVARFPTSPYAPQAMLASARLYFNSTEEAEAQKALVKLLDSYPQAPESKEAMILLAQSYFNQAVYDQAITYAEAFLRRYSKDDRAPAVQKQLEISVYQMALDKHNPKLFLSRFPKHALAEDLYWDLGLAAWKRKNYPEALELLQNLTLVFPESRKASRALYLLGDIYFQQNKYQESVAAFHSYLANDAREENLVPGIAFKVAVANFRQGIFVEAAKAFQNFIDQYPKDSQLRDAYLNLILSYQKAEKPAEGAEACKHFLKAFPGDAEASHTYLQMGHMLKSIGQGPKAAEAYQKVKKDSQYAIEAYYSLGQWYQEQADYQKALKAYEVLLPMRPRENEQRLSGVAMLAEFYERLGRKEESLKMYKEVAKFSQNPDWVAGAKQKIANLRSEQSQGGSQ